MLFEFQAYLKSGRIQALYCLAKTIEVAKVRRKINHAIHCIFQILLHLPFRKLPQIFLASQNLLLDLGYMDYLFLYPSSQPPRVCENYTKSR